MPTTFELTDSAVARALSGTRANVNLAGAGPAGAADPLCSVYKIISPILKALELAPFFPSKWKQAIDLFFQEMDKRCAAGGNPASAANFDAIDKAVKDAIAEHWKNFPTPDAAVNAVRASGGGVGAQICGAYKAIKPILDLAKLFVPITWSAGITAFEAVFDAICGG